MARNLELDARPPAVRPLLRWTADHDAGEHGAWPADRAHPWPPPDVADARNLIQGIVIACALSVPIWTGLGLMVLAILD
jgi:hypothetical protein